MTGHEAEAGRLVLAGVAAWYGSAQALFDVTLEVGPGECVVVLGRNGAGKTTSLRAVLGMIPTVRGARRFDGADLAGAATHEIARRGIGYVPEDRRVFSGLTVAETLTLARRSPATEPARWSRDRLFELFPRLAQLAERRGGTLSGGEQRMLAIARALAGNPRLVLLDEPSEGLAPRLRARITELIHTLRGQGVGLLICEQSIALARAVADRVVVLDRGRSVLTGSRAELPALLAQGLPHLGV